jgi:hypothetical protein
MISTILAILLILANLITLSVAVYSDLETGLYQS